MEFTARLRSLLFVPADNARNLQRARTTAADALILDLEDAVAPPNKETARRMAVEFLRDRGAFTGAVMVRVHARDSVEFEKDRQALAAAAPDAVVLSKCGSAADVLGHRPAAVLPMIESAAALVHAYEIAAASPRVLALAFGAEDFCADTGVLRTEGDPELLYARCALVTAARAAGREAIDTPFTAYRDEAGLRLAAQNSRNLGFSGKLAIHPAQASVINDIFRPTPAEIAEAERVVHWAAQNGPGATALDGRMVDEAVIRRARRTLSRA
jgi:citrate lyase subunit beta/citryl-CoA lyase